MHLLYQVFKFWIKFKNPLKFNLDYFILVLFQFDIKSMFFFFFFFNQNVSLVNYFQSKNKNKDGIWMDGWTAACFGFSNSILITYPSVILKEVFSYSVILISINKTQLSDPESSKCWTSQLWLPNQPSSIHRNSG